MTALTKQFIGNNQVDGTKIELLNAQAFNALNSSASQTALFNFSAANNFQFTVAVDMNSLGIINLANPVNPGDAVNYATAQALISNLSWKAVVISATTAALPTYAYASGVITATVFGALPAQDGVTLTVGQRLLVKNETGANQPYNGIYVVTTVGSVSAFYVLTRASDSNTAALLQSAAVCVGEAASTQAGYVFFENAPITTIGTDNVIYDQINAGMTYIGGDGITITGNSIAVNPASGGALSVAVGGVSVNVDAATIGINGSNDLFVNNAGITEVQIASSALSTTGALTGGSGTKLAVAVDGTTVSIVTDALHGLASQIDTLTLTGTDITNQYKDLTYPIAVSSSTWLSVIGGLVQQVGQDFSVSATGGVAGVGRITFLNGLASGGAQALISGNVLVVGYDHF